MGQGSLRARMQEAFRFRMFVFIGLVGFVFLIFIIQLFNLQIVYGKENLKKAKINMENNVPKVAPRGEIYDRNFQLGKKNIVLVSNRPSFNITTIPAKFTSKKELIKVVKRLSRLLKMDVNITLKGLKKRNSWERIILFEDVSFDMVVKIASNQFLFPNISWEDTPVRLYTYKNMLSHVTGYISSIGKKKLRSLKGRGYKAYHKIGKSGVERMYDEILRGSDGYIRRIVDHKNRTEGEETGLDPVSGKNIVLTIDYEVQKVAYDSMKNRMGSVIVMKPYTGEILALVSQPDYDPNEIISKNNQKIVRALYKNKKRPFLNRAIQSKYPPASTFKLVTAIAGLETEKTYADKVHYCPGKYTLKGYRDRDFYCYRVHNRLNLFDAIAKSCSVYFYLYGYATGPTSILRYASSFGLDEKTGIDLPGEVKGFIPSKQWKMKRFSQSWYDGDTLNLSIGQGFLTITPIALANFLSGVVNNGVMYQPIIIKEVRSSNNKRVLRGFQKKKLREIPLSMKTTNIVKLGMRKAVQYGTCQILKHLKAPLAGKTGTAQTRSQRKRDETQHAWFIGYGPYGGSIEKSVVVVVMVEYGVGGAAVAAPIARNVFAKIIEQGYFKE